MSNTMSAIDKILEKTHISQKKLDLLIAFAIAGGALIFYWPMIFPGNIGSADSMKYHFIGHVLGLSHPPGSPLYILLNWFVSHIPVGDMAWRINLFSAVCAAASGAMLYRIIVRLSRSRVAGVASAVLFLTASIPWSQALIAEVYMLWVLLALLSLYYLIEFEQNDSNLSFFLAWIFLGLSFAVHLSSVFLLPGFIIYAFRNKARMLRSVRGVGSMIAGTVFGLIPYLYYPIRYALNPSYTEYRIDGLGGFLSFITGGQYHQKYFAFTFDQFLGERLDWLNLILTKNFSFILWIFAITGCLLLLIHVRRVGILVSAMIACNLIFVLGYNVGDAQVFLLPSILGAAIAIGYLIAHLVRAEGKSHLDGLIQFLPPVCAFLFLIGATKVIEQETIIVSSILIVLFLWLIMYVVPKRYPTLCKWNTTIIITFLLLIVVSRLETLLLFAAFYLGTISVQKLSEKSLSHLKFVSKSHFAHAAMLFFAVVLLNDGNIQDTQRVVDYRRYLPKETLYENTLENLEKDTLFITSDQRNLFGPLYINYVRPEKERKRLHFGSHSTFCDRLRKIPYETWDFRKLNLAICSDLHHCLDDQRILSFRTDVNPSISEFLDELYDDVVIVLAASPESLLKMPQSEKNALLNRGILLPRNLSDSFLAILLKKDGIFTGEQISDQFLLDESITLGEKFRSNRGENINVEFSLERSSTCTKVSYGEEVVRTMTKTDEIQLICFSRPTTSFVDRFIINTTKGITLQRDYLVEVPYFQPYIHQQLDKKVSFARQLGSSKSIKFALAAAESEPYFLTVFIHAKESPTVHLKERAFIEGGRGELVHSNSFSPRRIAMSDLVNGNHLFNRKNPFAIQFRESDIDRVIELSLDGRFKDFEMMLTSKPLFKDPSQYEIPPAPNEIISDRNFISF